MLQVRDRQNLLLIQIVADCGSDGGPADLPLVTCHTHSFFGPNSNFSKVNDDEVLLPWDIGDFWQILRHYTNRPNPLKLSVFQEFLVLVWIYGLTHLVFLSKCLHVYCCTFLPIRTTVHPPSIPHPLSFYQHHSITSSHTKAPIVIFPVHSLLVSISRVNSICWATLATTNTTTNTTTAHTRNPVLHQTRINPTQQYNISPAIRGRIANLLIY